MAERTKAQKMRDVWLIHAVLLEGVRNWSFTLFSPAAREIEREVRAILQRYQGRLSDLPKATLAIIARRLRSVLGTAFRSYKRLFISMLKGFMAKDVEVFSFLLAQITGIPYDAAQKTAKAPLYGTLAASDTQRGNDRLWQMLSNAIVPASGLTITGMLDYFTNAATNNFVRALNSSYANNETIDALTTDLFGTDALNNRDGLLNRVGNAARTVGSTSLGFVSSVANAAVSSVYFQEYQWCSVLDSRTTRVCQDRADRIYVYGEGPQPPAHENCRSTIIPFDAELGGDGEENTFTSWLKAQPANTQDAMFAPSVLAQQTVNPANARMIAADEFSSYKATMLGA